VTISAMRAQPIAMGAWPSHDVVTRRACAAGHESLVPGFSVSGRAVAEMLDRLSPTPTSVRPLASR